MTDTSTQCRDQSLVQLVGSEVTREHRCIAFPNIYHHQVQPFELKDKSRPGHRKIVAFFLINPNRRIPSTTNIPAQQLSWKQEDLNEALGSKLPPELTSEISKHVEGTMTRMVAEEIRANLMKERSAMVEAGNSQYELGIFNMWQVSFYLTCLKLLTKLNSEH